MLPELATLGTVWLADKRMTTVAWYGYGPIESYPDRYRAATIGRWSRLVSEQYTHYPRPQDSGNKEQVTEFALRDEQGRGVVITTHEKPFSAKVLPYSAEQLATTTHDCFLEEHSSRNFVTLSAAVLGLGNSSCGPGVLKRYAIDKEKNHSLHLRIQPL